QMKKSFSEYQIYTGYIDRYIIKINFIKKLICIKMIVYILNSSSIPNVRSQKLKQLFSNDMFTVFIVNPIPQGGWNSLPLNQLTLEQVMEIYQYQWCLNDAKLKYPEENVIVVKENSVSNVSPDT